ncbi:hypothetical protein EVJ58_g10614 [Rhodofomes roseus]|uniref:Uncharacterized protein n=1 Tax=Rhodofomes roseus TaxID=34475 RepID=A0A4Y9XMN8_9APHY|nr:hypothetical protein EVJ58_g10614 [Rhodofomes roseus]
MPKTATPVQQSPEPTGELPTSARGRPASRVGPRRKPAVPDEGHPFGANTGEGEPVEFKRGKRVGKKARLNKKAEAQARAHTQGMAAAAAGSSKAGAAGQEGHHNEAAALVSNQPPVVLSWTNKGPTPEMCEAVNCSRLNKTFTHWECLTAGVLERFQKDDSDDDDVVIDEDRLTLDRSLNYLQKVKVERSIQRKRKLTQETTKPLRTDEEKNKARIAKKHRRKVVHEAEKKEKRLKRAALKDAQKGKGKAVAGEEDRLSTPLSEAPPSPEV